MSKNFRSFLLVFTASVQILHLFNNSSAQDLEATVKIDAGTPSIAYIEGRFLKERTGQTTRNLQFLLDYAGISGLGERISEVRLTGNGGKLVASRRMIPGEYLAEGDIRWWSYDADLAPLKNLSAAAHVSWLDRDGGLIMLDDLLPIVGGGRRSAKVWFEVPGGWKIVTAERQIAPQVFDVQDVENAVFYIGKDRRENDLKAGGSRLKLTLAGLWLFSDKEAAAMAVSIHGEYGRLFGSAPAADFYLSIGKFPIAAAIGNWEADTRGRSITIISSDMPFKSQSLQRLHEQLRHEIFHLWIPNGVNLSGNYDWFYEGFALYESLKTGVAVNRIRFDDFLDTLSRASNIDNSQTQQLSLIDASKNRWNGASTQIYARGMLVAFLCDVALLEKSKGKRSVSDDLRAVYERHRPPAPPRNGNDAVLAILRSHGELVPIIDRYITGAERIDLTALLKAAGLEADNKGQLKVMAKPSGRQKDLLDKLGYNSWRRLSESN